MSVQVQLHLSEQLIQEMIRQRIRKIEEIRQSMSSMKVRSVYSDCNPPFAILENKQSLTFFQRYCFYTLTNAGLAADPDIGQK